MSDPKKQPDSPNGDDYDPEWEQERPFWEAYQRGEYKPEDRLTMEQLLEEYPELRPFMKIKEQTSEDE